MTYVCFNRTELAVKHSLGSVRQITFNSHTEVLKMYHPSQKLEKVHPQADWSFPLESGL